MESLNAGELIQFDDLYTMHLQMIYGYFVRRTAGDRTAAEDLTQETFLAAARTWSPAVREPSAWLIAIARRRMVDHIRRNDRRRKLIERAAQDAATHTHHDRSEAEERLDLALSRLKPDHRLAVILHHADGLPIGQVSKLMNRSPRAVESLLARARTALRQAYEENTDD